MAVVVNATVGDPAANSFATLLEGDVYHEAHPTPEAWDDATADEQARALVTATRMIVQKLSGRWRGYAATETQALPFPRFGVYTRNDYPMPTNIVPEDLKVATIELARLLLEGNAGVTAGADTLKQLKAGPVELVFRDDVPVTSGFPDAVYDMIAYLTTGSGSGGVRSVQVTRV